MIHNAIELDWYALGGFQKPSSIFNKSYQLTKVFKSNQSHAVRLPKAVEFPEYVKDVEIVVVGNGRIVTPINQSWDSWFVNTSVSDDFMIDREQPVMQERESLDD